ALRHATETYAGLRKAHPDAHCELDHESVFQLLVATVMSAQTTDVNVNKATPALFGRWPDPKQLAAASRDDVEATISSIGMFRQKAKNIVRLSQLLMADHGGTVPETLEELVALPGVGRKTANVVLGVAWNKPEGVVVDTHVQRIGQRLGWTKNTTPEKIELDLARAFPREDWAMVSHTLIFHGRRVCTARKPACAACTVSEACPSAFKAENIGRKPPKARRTTDAGTGSTKAATKKPTTKRVSAKTAPTKRTTKAARSNP
ncbi:MAG: endonuclease III, partial [Deltaproteobacteria bacterium]|nr:endonuclease III [Deltaproteobacteria bacterium]